MLEVGLNGALGALAWAALCFSSLQLQVGGILVGYLASKPALLSSLRDRVNCDTARAFQAGLSIYILVCLLVSLGVVLSYYPALVLSHSADFFGSLFFLHLAAGVVVRYAQVKLKAVDILSDEGRAHQIIRVSLGTLALLVVAGRIHVGAYSSSFPLLLKDQKMDIRVHISLAIMSSIVLTSLFLNIVLRILIWVEKNRDDSGSTSSSLIWKNLSGNKYVLVSLVSFSPMVVNVIMILSGKDGGFVRNFAVGMFCIVAPFFIITTKKKIRNFVFKSLVQSWPALARLEKLRKNNVSPVD